MCTSENGTESEWRLKYESNAELEPLGCLQDCSLLASHRSLREIQTPISRRSRSGRRERSAWLRWRLFSCQQSTIQTSCGPIR